MYKTIIPMLKVGSCRKIRSNDQKPDNIDITLAFNNTTPLVQ